MISNFGETNDIAVTVLVDNRTDLLARSTDTVKYFTDEALVAEHGFSALIHLKAAGIKILWDAGITRTGLMENARNMEIDLTQVDKIALSHGHGDHTAAMTNALEAINVQPEFKKWEKDIPLEKIIAQTRPRRTPLVAHPAIFRERWAVDPDGTKYGPNFPPSRAQWEAAGADIILSEGPYQLGPGCWTTGAVPRRSFEKSGVPSIMAYLEGQALVPDHIEDDQAIIINVKDKGLVIVAGCAHSGIVNTVNYAQEISGVDKVHAILGGFHLARASDEELGQTIAAIKQFRPAIVAPSHCTGAQAIHQFASQMPAEFVVGLVGVTFLF